MYAILQSGGKQHRVSVGQVIRVEKIDLQIGESVIFDRVMMIVNLNVFQIGCPFLDSCNIMGEVIRHGRDSKIMVIKFRRRKHFRKSQGHRQHFTDIKIKSINVLN